MKDYKTNIKSLKDLRSRKSDIEHQLTDCEQNIQEKYNKLVNPVKLPLMLFSGKKDKKNGVSSAFSLKDATKSLLNMNNIITAVSLGIIVYKKVKQRRALKQS
jgi:hypothetical protein